MAKIDPEVAVEEPQPKADDTPPVIETPTEPPVETPTEAVPASDQEPGEKPESGDRKIEDEAPSIDQVRQDFLDEIEELRKSDPKLAAEMSERFDAKEQDVGEERFEWERERSRTERTQAWERAQGAYAQYAPDAVQPQIVNVLTQLNERIKVAAQDLHDGKIENPNQVQFDPEGWGKLLAPVLTGGQGAIRELMASATQSVIIDSLEAHPAHRYLTADERKQFRVASTSGQYAEAIKLHLDAAIRAAPEAVAKQATEKAEKDAELLDRFAKVRTAMGKNGKGMLTGGASAAAKGPTTLEEIDEALRTGPTAAIDGLLKRRTALIE